MDASIMKSLGSTIPLYVKAQSATVIIKNTRREALDKIFIYKLYHISGNKIPPLPEGLGYRAHVRPPSLVAIDVAVKGLSVFICIETSQLPSELPHLGGFEA